MSFCCLWIWLHNTVSLCVKWQLLLFFLLRREKGRKFMWLLRQNWVYFVKNKTMKWQLFYGRLDFIEITFQMCSVWDREYKLQMEMWTCTAGKDKYRVWYGDLWLMFESSIYIKQVLRVQSWSLWSMWVLLYETSKVEEIKKLTVLQLLNLNDISLFSGSVRVLSSQPDHVTPLTHPLSHLSFPCSFSFL